MIWLSYNYRGLANPKKRLALKMLLKDSYYDILFLQETPGAIDNITRTLHSILPGWIFQGMDAIGKSGGLAIGFNPKTVKHISTWGGMGFIGMDIFVGELGLQLKVINIYAPNQNRLDFWHNLLEHNLVSNTTIIGGDLNFSLGMEESWGHHAQIDPIFDQMSTLLDTCKLADVPMNKKLPTWHNRQTREAALGRKLDRFLIHEDLIHYIPLYRQWVSSGGSSDHLPIYLQITGPSKKPRSPYKFFTGHLKDPDYINLVTEF